MALSQDARDAIAQAPVGRDWDEDSPDVILAAVLPDGCTIAQALDEVDVLGQCVQSLYQWIVEFDRDPGPVTDYLSAPHAEVADAACAKWRDIDWTNDR